MKKGVNMINVTFEVINLKDQIDILNNFISRNNPTSEYIAETLGFDLALPKHSRDKIIANS